MKNCTINPLPAVTVKLSTVIIFLFLFLPQIEAQKGNKPAPPPTSPSPADRVDMQLREMQLRSLELMKEGDKKAVEVSPETIKNVKEDFARIQEINTEIMRSYSSGSAPDFAYLADATAEINKRASRLKTNLLLPEPSDKENEADKQPVKSPLMTLSRLISSFVTNPIFQNSNTIDAEQGTKARRDLESIIELSDKIRKSAEKLSKTPGKSN